MVGVVVRLWVVALTFDTCGEGSRSSSAIYEISESIFSSASPFLRFFLRKCLF